MSETNSYDSQGLFSVYFMLGEYENLAGITKGHFYEIEGLFPTANYIIRVELMYPHSALISSATTQHLLVLSEDTNPTDAAALGNTTTVLPTNSQLNTSYMMYTIIAVLVILVAILLLTLLVCVLIVCALKIRTKSKASPFPKAHTDDVYQEMDNTPRPPMYQNNKLFLSNECVDVPKPTRIEVEVDLS